MHGAAHRQTVLAKALAGAAEKDFDGLPADQRGFWLYEAQKAIEALIERGLIRERVW